MKIAGIDIGSRYIKYVLLQNEQVLEFQRKETGYSPLSVCNDIINYSRPDRLVATGYGRHLLEVHGNVKTVTEIKAAARGTREVFPNCRTIIDIGGQDTKVISLYRDGKVKNFEMNDRCAAGTGRFLEIMANALGYDMESFGDHSIDKPGNVKINSLCTVFAESEVISLITKGEKREVIAHAVHGSIASKVIAMIKRIDIKDDVVFVGGCASNSCLRKMLEDRLQKKLYVNDNPQILAALGAALYAGKEV